jgi:hypothetical protein
MSAWISESIYYQCDITGKAFTDDTNSVHVGGKEGYFCYECDDLKKLIWVGQKIKQWWFHVQFTYHYHNTCFT